MSCSINWTCEHVCEESTCYNLWFFVLFFVATTISGAVQFTTSSLILLMLNFRLLSLLSINPQYASVKIVSKWRWHVSHCKLLTGIIHVNIQSDIYIHYILYITWVWTAMDVTETWIVGGGIQSWCGNFSLKCCFQSDCPVTASFCNPKLAQR